MQHMQKCNYNRLGYSKMAYEMQQSIHVFNLELKYNAVSMMSRTQMHVRRVYANMRMLKKHDALCYHHKRVNKMEKEMGIGRHAL